MHLFCLFYGNLHTLLTAFFKGPLWQLTFTVLFYYHLMQYSSLFNSFKLEGLFSNKFCHIQFQVKFLYFGGAGNVPHL